MPAKRRASLAPSPAAMQNCTAIGSQIGPIAASRDAALDQGAKDRRGIARRPAARIVGRIGDHHRAALDRERAVDALVDAEEGRRGLAAQREQPLAQLLGQQRAELGMVVGDHQHLGAHARHVAEREAVRDRDRQDAVLALAAP